MGVFLAIDHPRGAGGVYGGLSQIYIYKVDCRLLLSDINPVVRTPFGAGFDPEFRG